MRCDKIRIVARYLSKRLGVSRARRHRTLEDCSGIVQLSNSFVGFSQQGSLASSKFGVKVAVPTKVTGPCTSQVR